MIRKTFIRHILDPLVFIVAVILVFEEWLWDTLKIRLQRLSRLPAVAAFELQIRKLPPWAALLVLILPGIILIPFKVAAIYLIAHHRPFFGLFTLLIAKLTGTALAAYLFDLVRNNARRLSWFNVVYLRIIALLDSAKIWLHRHPTYSWIQTLKARLKYSLQQHQKQQPWILRKLQTAKIRATQFWNLLLKDFTK
ncbi:MAG: hypothetical protein WCO60_11255 [Verrucomicrobiota bacterium]